MLLLVLLSLLLVVIANRCVTIIAYICYWRPERPQKGCTVLPVFDSVASCCCPYSTANYVVVISNNNNDDGNGNSNNTSNDNNNNDNDDGNGNSSNSNSRGRGSLGSRRGAAGCSRGTRASLLTRTLEKYISIQSGNMLFK